MNSATRVVLVVEDDEGMREAMDSLLGAAGFAPVIFECAESLLAGDAIDGATCVVSDIRLPAMSGLELLATLRARGVRTPVIVITAHDTPETRSEAARLGAAAYLPKPFLGSDLLAAIKVAAGQENAA